MILILAAIDIGSNAARLLINEVSETDGEPQFKKLNLVRVPLRLGFDVFGSNRISDEKISMFREMMLSFSHLMKAYKVNHVKACATSAMRGAENAAAIIELIRHDTGITVEVIDGETEALIVYENHVAEHLTQDQSYLYIDVGGGSTEISFFSNGILVSKRSFDIGTIRMLKGTVRESDWELLKNTIKAITKGHRSVMAIGSGGNINKIFSLSKRKEGRPLPLELLRDYYYELSSMNITERIAKYDFRDDRADVIVPALQIYINAMKWAGAEEITVPKIGLADGLIHHLYEEITSKRQS